MKKKNFFRHFVETLPARFLLATMLLAPMGASAQVTIGSGDLPQATLDIIGDTATVHGEAFRLIDGNQKAGKVLTCQENGVGTWKEPLLTYTPIPTAVSTININTSSINSESLYSDCTITNSSTSPLFKTIGSRHFSLKLLLTTTDGTPYSIDFPDYGTYFVSLEIKMNLPNVLFRDITCDHFPSAILQLRATPSLLDWNANTPDKRFTGQYEVHAQFGSTETRADFRFAMNQMIQVTEETGLKGYLMSQIIFTSYPEGMANHTDVPLPSATTPLTITTYIGNNADTIYPQASGGAFVKMAEIMQ